MTVIRLGQQFFLSCLLLSHLLVQCISYGSSDYSSEDMSHIRDIVLNEQPLIYLLAYEYDCDQYDRQRYNERQDHR